MPSFHLFTQIRIILDYHVWDHFCTKRNLNKQIWVFWAPVFEKKSNWVQKNIFFTFSLSINPSSISQIHIYVVFAMSQIQISGLLLHLRDKACIILYHHTQPQNTIFHQFKGKTVSSALGWPSSQKILQWINKISQKILLYVKRLWPWIKNVLFDFFSLFWVEKMFSYCE